MFELEVAFGFGRRFAFWSSISRIGDFVQFHHKPKKVTILTKNLSSKNLHTTYLMNLKLFGLGSFLTTVSFIFDGHCWFAMIRCCLMPLALRPRVYFHCYLLRSDWQLPWLQSHDITYHVARIHAFDMPCFWLPRNKTRKYKVRSLSMPFRHWHAIAD